MAAMSPPRGAIDVPVPSSSPERDASGGWRSDLLQSVLDNVPAMIGYWDRDLRNVVANRPYLSWFGKTPEQIKGRHIAELLGPDLYQANLPFMRAALDGEAQEFDREIIDPGGNRRYSQASYIPDVDEHGAVHGFFVLVSDVTSRVQAEQRLVAEQRRTATLAGQLRIVSRVSAAMHDLEPAEVQEAIADAVIDLGYQGSNLALIDWENSLFTPSHGRGPFATFNGLSLGMETGSTREVLRANAPVVIADYQSYPEAIEDIRATGVRSTISLPVRVGGRLVAVLHAGSQEPLEVTDSDLEVLGLLADLAGTALANGERLLQSRAATRFYARAAETDPLTGVGNRRAADQMLAELGAEDVLAVLDLDHFKDVNDTHGHAVGDSTLRQLTDVVSSQLREQDQFARLGGEEFLLALPGLSLGTAAGVLRRIREAWVSTDPVATFSAGLARTRLGESSAEVYLRADAALYRAKDEGRDRIVIDQT